MALDFPWDEAAFEDVARVRAHRHDGSVVTLERVRWEGRETDAGPRLVGFVRDEEARVVEGSVVLEEIASLDVRRHSALSGFFREAGATIVMWVGLGLLVVWLVEEDILFAND